MMKSYGLFGILGFIVLPFVLALPARAEDTPNVFISEINWAGSEISTADEWIELVNLGQLPVDLSRWVLTGTASGGGALEIAEGTVLEPGHTLLIANYALNDAKTSLLFAPELVTTAISLPNSALEILLTTPEGLVIDSYVDTGTPDFGASNPATSIERNLATLTWQSSTQNQNLSVSSQFGTPGFVDLPSPPADPAPVEPDPVVIETESQEQPSGQQPPENVDPVIPETEVAPAPLPQPCTEVVQNNPEESITPIEVTETTTASPEPTLPEEPTDQLAQNSLVAEQEMDTTAPDSQSSAELLDTSVVQPIAPSELSLNELVSDPLDATEWVEIMNTGSRSLDLTGITLVDAGGQITLLPTYELPVGAFYVIENPKGKLNNSGDSITLFDSYGTLLDTITYGTTDYPAPQDGESLARNSDGVWLITSATRNATNVFMEAVTEPVESPLATSNLDVPVLTPSNSDQETNSATYETLSNESNSPSDDSGTVTQPVAEIDHTGTTGTESVHRIVAIAKSVVANSKSSATKAKDAAKQTSTLTVFTGTVIALPDTFGKQILYLDGREIYFHAAKWPVLALGDVVQATGTESTSNGSPRLKISSAEDLVITGHGQITPTPIDGQEFATLPHGSLVSIAGKVISRSGNELNVQTDDGTDIRVLANKRTGVSWSSIQSGSIILTGIVKHSDSGSSLNVRTNEDVFFTPDTQAEAITSTKSPQSSSPLIGGGLLTGSVGALGTWYLKSRKGLLSWLPF